MVGGGPAGLAHHLICLTLPELRIYRGSKRGKISIYMARKRPKVNDQGWQVRNDHPKQRALNRSNW